MGVWAGVGAAVGGLASAGASAATAPGSPDAPDPMEMSWENARALEMQARRAWRINNLWNPAYSGIGNQTAEMALFGSPNRFIQMYQGKDDGRPTKRVNIGGQPGLLDIYQRAGSQMADFNRRQQITDMNIMGPATTAAYFNSSPIAESLMRRATDGMAEGGSLDPSTRRTLQQSALGDASLRGFGHSPLDAFMAYSSMGAEAEARKRQNEQFALQVNSMFDPFSQIGRPSFASTLGPALGMQGAQWGRQSSVPALNPFAMGNAYSGPMPQGSSATSDMFGAVSGGLFNLAGSYAANASRNRAPAYQPTAQNPDVRFA